ncbi:MAG TPA: hypothetical protein VF521_11185 [Pyrinomonadaceae bacterium]|jgi:hypothetical protein
MRRLTLLTVTLLLSAGAGGYRASAQSIANTRPAQTAHVEVSIRPQPDSPLRVTFVGESPEELKTPHVLLAVENVGAKSISAYSIGCKLTVRGEEVVTPGVGASAIAPVAVLNPGDRRAAGVPNPERSPVQVWVDFVEFTDGTTWGPDATKYSEHLAGRRAGVRAEAGRLRELLKAGGGQAFAAALESTAAGPGRPAGKSKQWEDGFSVGVLLERGQVRRAYLGGGPAGAESELQQP